MTKMCDKNVTRFQPHKNKIRLRTGDIFVLYVHDIFVRDVRTCSNSNEHERTHGRFVRFEIELLVLETELFEKFFKEEFEDKQN